MSVIARQREIIDRRGLWEKLEELPEERDGVVALLKAALRQGHAEVRRRFEAGGLGTASIRENSFLVDQIVRLLFDFATIRAFPLANPTKGEHLSVVAVGGYGRGELAPYSDVDLLFLLPYKTTPHTEQVVEWMLYGLWDLGLKVGHATRSIEECLRGAQADLTIRTSLLEARWVWGDQTLYDQLRKRFDADIVKGRAAEFVEAKLAERDLRHDRVGDSRYVLEPNVKEGKGGLRDLHTLFWIAKYAYRVDDVAKLVEHGLISEEELGRFERAHNFLWTVRCHLHYLAGRAEERLGFDVQAEIGRRMGYTDHAGTRGVERFMKHYFLTAKDVGDLTRIFCAVLEAEHEKKPRFAWLRPSTFRKKLIEGFAVDAGRVTVAKESAFRDDPVNLLRLFHVAQENELDVHPRALRLVTQSLKLIDSRLRDDPEANRLFLEMLTSAKDPETTLRRLNEAGVFGRFVPDFGRVVAQMQYDMYHVYTVDEHTLFAIGILAAIERGELQDEAPIASSVVHQVLSRRVLYLAVLLHDIAKGRGGDHSELGEKVALRLGPRLGLSDEETEQVAWLVRWHLLMSNTAFKRDIDDPKTVEDFVARVQSPERLKLLLVLTVADIRAVGPKTWNNWKATLLRELYTRAIEVMSGGQVAEARQARIRAAEAAAREKLAEFDDAAFADFAAKAYPYYWLAFDAEAIARHARMIRDAEARGAPLTVDKRVDSARGVTEVTLYTGDHPGLFTRIAGALALAGADIVDARIVTMTNGMALDTFWVQDAGGGAFDRPDKLAKLAVHFENVLSGRTKAHLELAKKRPAQPKAHAFPVTPRVLIDNKASAGHTIIEVNGRDRPGLLYELTRALTALNLQISSAKISTYGEKVVDVFYVKNLFGHKVEHESRLEEIRKSLLTILAEPERETAAPVRRPRRAAAAAE